MKKISPALNKGAIYVFVTGIVMFMTLILAGCFENYGRLRPSSEVNDLFESHQVLPEYRYYYSGPDSIPDAVMGVHRDYSLDPGLWKEVALTSKQLKDWIERMTHNRGYSVSTYGSYILDPAGKRIGIWYSPWDWSVIKMEKDNRVVISLPDTSSGLRVFGLFGTMDD